MSRELLPRKDDLVCQWRTRSGDRCDKPAKWFISGIPLKTFVCGNHAQRFAPEAKFPITDQVIQNMADFDPTWWR